MPVEIKELKIKAVIISPDQMQKKSPDTITAAQIESLKREIKRECIQAVKQFMNDQKER
jgi:hypothetical protein